ncbi:MAG: PHP domain-containing protein [Chloroflexi bacterium]|nr:PHP domain-containing protein [Chloroflexota bacterium]
MGFADLHIHSIASDGTATIAAILHHASMQTDLDVIAITDHDQLDSSLRACELAAHTRITAIPGMEISTRDGHLLALFLQTSVPAGLSFVETAERVRLVGGFPVAAHPLDPLAKSIGGKRLRQIAGRYPGLLAGIEVDNGSQLDLRRNAASQLLRWDTGLPGLGCSDAHTLSAIGNTRTAFAGASAEDLRQALTAGTLVPLPTHRPPHFIRHYILHLILRYGLGIIDDVNGPRRK